MDNERIAKLMAYLEGALEPQASAAFEKDLADDGELRLEYESLRPIHEDLRRVGEECRAEIPTVDLSAQIEAALHAGLGRETAGSADLMAYLDGELDELSNKRFERRSAARADLRAEVAALSRLQDEIADAGEAFARGVPEVNLTEQVKARLPEASEDDRTSASEVRALAELEEDLEALGRDFAAGLPAVQLRGAVMRSINEERRERPRITPLKAPPRPQSAPAKPAALNWTHWAGLAAAACALFVLGFLSYPLLQGRDAGMPRIADVNNLQELTPTPSSLPVPAQPLFEETAPPATVIAVEASAAVPELPAESSAPAGRPIARPKAFGLQDALNVYQQAMRDEEDMAERLAAWTNLERDDARSLLEGGSYEARLGAAEFLPPSEADAVLEEALRRQPDDFHARFALAMNDSVDGVYGQASLDNAAAWERREPENALPTYIEARILLAQGEPEQALQNLDEAQSLDQATPHSLEGARYHARALEESGMEKDTAEFLAAAGAGTKAYADLMDLSNELLQQGSFYESQGELDTAEKIYDAVLGFGTQLSDGATLANERLAGLDTQRKALGALEQLYRGAEDETGLATLDEANGRVLADLTDFAAFVADFNTLLEGSEARAAAQLSALVLDQGNLAIFELLQ